MVNALAGLGVGRQRTVRFAVEKQDRRVAGSEVVDRRGVFVELVRPIGIELVVLQAVKALQGRMPGGRFADPFLDESRVIGRSEERRVGKECRARWIAYPTKDN